MNKKLLLIPIIMCVSLIMSLAFSAAIAEAGIGFAQVHDNLDLRKNTKLHVKEYWKTVEGKEVDWSGAVSDVKSGRGKAEVFIVNRERAVHRGHNIVINVTNMEKAARLKKGQKIRFKGYLHDYRSGRRGEVIITLRDAEIL